MTFPSSAAPRAAIAVLATLACVASAQSPIIAKHVPAIVQSGQAKLISSLDVKTKLRLDLNMPLRNQAELNVLLADLYNPQSPNFHHWLTPAQFNLSFGPSQNDVQKLADWAKSKGFTITYQAGNGRIVTVEGSVASINSAFHVTEKTYHDAVLDRDFHAPDQAPTTDLPFALLSVDNLENSNPPHNYLMKDPSAGVPDLLRAPTAGVLSAKGSAAHPNVSGSGPDSMYLPSDMRAAYYGSGNLTGAGQNVDIFSFDGYLTSDIGVYAANTGVTNTVPVSNVLVSGYSGGCFSSTNGTSGTCDDGEQILDIEQVEGMAPGLNNIYFYEGTSANPILNQMVMDDDAAVITSSWGGGGFGTASDTYFMQMATQGQSYLSATGDDGAFNKNTEGAPSLDPYITQVGGTELTTSGPGGTWTGEVGWDDSGGGYWITGIGTSSKYTIPTWQTAAVNSTNKASATYRNVPDMAAEANFDNPTAINGVFSPGYGGTSFATPRVAGYMALANQQAVENGAPTLGFLNPALYSAGANASYTSLYHDITSGTNPAAEGTTVYSAVTGYDLVTGWGSPNGPGLLNFLAGQAVPDYTVVPTPVSVLRPASGTTTVTSTINLTPINGFSGTTNVGIGNLPAGVTAVATSGTPSSPPTVTFTVSSSVVAATTYNIEIAVGNSVVSHLSQIPLTILKRANSDFTISATAASINTGSTGSSTITVTPGSGLANGVSLVVTGVPPGITATLSTATTPAASTANVTLTLAVTGYATPNTYELTVTGTSGGGIIHTAVIPVTVTLPTNLLSNGGFESGAASPWTFTTQSGTAPIELLTTSSGIPPHTGNYFALLEGGAAAGTDVMTQQITIPSGSIATYGAWYWVLTEETVTTATDVMSFQLIDSSGTTHTLGSVSNLNQNGYWAYTSFDVSPYIGQTVTIQISANQAGTAYTDFLLDDVSVSVQ